MVRQARDYTRKVIQTDLENQSWRRFQGKPRPFNLALTDLSEGQRDILIAVQDPRFYSHGGFDPRRVTGLSQGLVKVLYFKDFKPGIAKIKQTLIAMFALDALVAKDDQLLLFINLAYMGHLEGTEIRGFGEAAEVYFQRPLNALSPDEYLSLVAMLSGPNRLDPVRHPKRNADRVAQLKSLLNL